MWFRNGPSVRGSWADAIDQDRAIELAKKSEVPIYDHEKQVELMAKQMGLDVSELDGIEPPYSGDDVFIL